MALSASCTSTATWVSGHGILSSSRSSFGQKKQLGGFSPKLSNRSSAQRTAVRATAPSAAATVSSNSTSPHAVAALNGALDANVPATKPAYDKPKRRADYVRTLSNIKLAAEDGPPPFELRSMWSYIYDGLAKNFPGIKDPNVSFQFPLFNTKADWNNAADYTAAVFGDTTPDNTGLYYVHSEKRISQAYMDYLTTLQPVDYAANADYVRVVTRLNAARAAAKTKAAEAMTAWRTWLAQNPDFSNVDYEKWLGSPIYGGNGYMSAIKQAQLDIEEQAATLAALFDIAHKPLADAIIQASATKTNYNAPGNTPVSIPTTEITPPLSDDVSKWVNSPADKYEFDVTIDKHAEYTTAWTEHVHTEIDYQPCCTRTKVDIDYSRIVTDVDFKMQVKAVGFGAYNISRPSWFNPDWFTDKSVTLMYSGAPFSEDTFFGPKGSLAFIPSMVLVLYKPVVIVTMSSTTFHESVKDTLAASASVSFFGMDFNATAAQSKTIFDSVNSTYTVTFDTLAGPAATPQIVGVISESHLKTPPAGLHSMAATGAKPARKRLPSGYWPPL